MIIIYCIKVILPLIHSLSLSLFAFTHTHRYKRMRPSANVLKHMHHQRTHTAVKCPVEQMFFCSLHCLQSISADPQLCYVSYSPGRWCEVTWTRLLLQCVKLVSWRRTTIAGNGKRLTQSFTYIRHTYYSTHAYTKASRLEAGLVFLFPDRTCFVCIKVTNHTQIFCKLLKAG